MKAIVSWDLNPSARLVRLKRESAICEGDRG